MSAGTLSGHDPEQLTLQIWALAHGLASLELSGAFGEADMAETLWISAVDAMVVGLTGKH